MKKLSITLMWLTTFCVLALATAFDESDFSSLGRIYQAIPGAQEIGGDNGPGRGIHHSGENCGSCHREGGRAESHLFTMSGTLYSDRLAGSASRGGEIVMEDREGNVISMTSNVAGNFWSYAPVASDPYTFSTTHGHEPFQPLYVEDAEGNLIEAADPESSRTWKYKTWVRRGNLVRPMVSIASVGGGTATTTRMSCNMHHGGVAHRAGGLWVGGAPTLPSYPVSGLSYRKHVYPILRSNCSPCHIPGRTITSMNTKTDHGTPSTAVDYSGGLDLMTYGGSAVDAPVYDPVIPYKVTDYETINKVGISAVVDTADPGQSLLLRKIIPGALHGGGAFWERRHADYAAIRQWIGEGALNN